MSEYLLLLHIDDALTAQPGKDIDPSHLDFMAKHGASLRGGAALGGSAAATTVRVADDGTVAVTDGLFAESKEVMGGYYIVEAPDLDEALAIAADVPVHGGAVEVRPIVVRH
jgi:hypothetical protein